VSVYLKKKSTGKLDEGIYFQRDPGSDTWQFRNNVSVLEIMNNGHGASNPSNSEPEQTVADGMPPEKLPVNANGVISPSPERT